MGTKERKKEKSGAGNGRCLSVSLSRLGTVTKMMLFVSHWQINRCCAAGIGVMVVLDSISPDARERERESVREWIVEHPVTAFLFIFVWPLLSVSLSLPFRLHVFVLPSPSNLPKISLPLLYSFFTCLFTFPPSKFPSSLIPLSFSYFLTFILYFCFRIKTKKSVRKLH